MDTVKRVQTCIAQSRPLLQHVDSAVIVLYKSVKAFGQVKVFQSAQLYYDPVSEKVLKTSRFVMEFLSHVPSSESVQLQLHCSLKCTSNCQSGSYNCLGLELDAVQGRQSVLFAVSILFLTFLIKK